MGTSQQGAVYSKRSFEFRSLEDSMLFRFRIAIGLTLLLALGLAVPAFAGGWAVITLDELPKDVAAGEPITIGFTVLQHGRTPMDGLDATVTARLSLTETFVAKAEPDGEPGHYVATLKFPKEGHWEWSIQAFAMDQSMPVLQVAAPGIASGSTSFVSTEPVTPLIPPLFIVRTLALALGLIGLVVIARRQSRLAMVLTGLCLVVGIASFITGTGTASDVEAQSKSASPEISDPDLAPVELGRQLFIAKGCITCHYNTKAAQRSDYWTIEMGAPDLSNFSASPEVLFVRLKDPAAAKSDTKMPNLGLKETEIEALIAFINSK